MIIENLGLPGCGKSTVADSLRKENPSSSYKILLKGQGEQDEIFQSIALKGLKSKIRILVIGFWAALGHPRIALHLFKHLSAFGLDVQRFILGMVIMDRIAKVKGISRSKEHFFIDEGLFQFFGSLAVGSASNMASNNFYKQYLSLHDFKLVYHRISPEDSYRRLMDRSNGHTRFEKMNPNDALGNLRLMQRQFDLIIEQARLLGIRVLELDANQSIEAKVQHLKDFVKP